MGRGRRRSAGAARPRLADVRPHPAQGSRALYPLGRSRCGTEARSLEALLEVLSQRISDSRTELTMISQHLMQLGDEATGKLSGITREFDFEHRAAGASRRSARPRGRNRAHRHRGSARRFAARRTDRALRRRAAARHRQRVRRTDRASSASRSTALPTAPAKPTGSSARQPIASRPGSPRSTAPARPPPQKVDEAEAQLLRHARRAARADLGDPRQHPLRHRRPGGRRCGPGRAGLGRHRQDRRRSSRSAGAQR